MKPFDAYRSAARVAMTPRRAEHEALQRAAQALRAAKDDPTMLEDAVRVNRLLWSILITDAADPSNHLPDSVKANILALGNFVAKTLAMLPADPSPGRLDSIAVINSHLAMGLV